MNPSPRSFSFPVKIHLINIVTSLLGAVLVVFFLLNINGGEQLPLFSQPAPLFVSFVLVIILVIASILIQKKYMLPGWRWISKATEKEPLQPAPPEIQKQALNLPFQSTRIAMFFWLLGGLVFAVLNGFYAKEGIFSIEGFLSVFIVASLIIGPATALLNFFVLERVWKSMLPVFFTGADLTRTLAFRLGVRSRIFILFIVGTVPLILFVILAHVLSTKLIETPYLGSRTSILELVFGLGGILLSLVLARILSISLLEPLETLTPRLNALQQGMLNERAPVLSNDELGILASRFNSMADALQIRGEELNTIYHISREISDSLELDDTLQAILEEVREIVHYDGGEICLYDKETNVLRVRAWTSSAKVITDTRGKSYQLGEGYTGWVGAEQKSLLIPDVDSHEGQKPVVRQIADGVFLNGYLGVPLLVGQRMVGTLEVVSTRKWFFNEHTRQILEIIAPQAAIAIANAEEVIERERNLKAQIEELKIQIDQVKRSKQVSEITESGFFQKLKEDAKRMRRMAKGEE